VRPDGRKSLNMARSKKDAKVITKEDIEEYLGTQSSFDLELFADRSLRDRGFLTSHGGSYFDPFQKKARQYDVRAYAHFEQHCMALLSVECKALAKTFPLIVSRVPRPDEDAYHELIQTWGRKDSGEWFREPIRSNVRMPLYKAGDLVGKDTVQIGRTILKNGSESEIDASDAETYDKWSQALSSATDLIEETLQLRGENGIGNAYSFILPILVVSDECLWVVDYSDTGPAAPQQVQETTLFVDRTYVIPTRNGFHPDNKLLKVTHLHIFTRRGFIDFLDRLRSPSPMALRERIFGFVFR
jgi:hypothetical protein